MDGLLVKKDRLDLILDGKVSIEVRGSAAKNVGEQIYLLDNDTKTVRGVCKLAKSYRFTPKNWEELSEKHKIYVPYDLLQTCYPKPYAWELAEVTPVTEWAFHRPDGVNNWVYGVKREHQKGA
jgi:hypothetical protein